VTLKGLELTRINAYESLGITDRPTPITFEDLARKVFTEMERNKA